MSRGSAFFDDAAEGSIRRVVTLSDPETDRLLRTLKRRRGGSGQLFAY